MLGQSDFVAICAPETPETRGLFDAPALGRMKRGAYLINIGRGKIVRLDALVAALESGHLAGAGLDVFEVEPLPADHPLWGMENVIVTPHMAGLGPHTAARRHEILLENVRRFAAGRELINAVDKTRWF
jgi:phosphoglycerate dehydrogenase-like enzyme